MTSVRSAFTLPPTLCRITVASWIAGVGLWVTALVLLSIP
jgi:hypothetical protein